MDFLWMYLGIIVVIELYNFMSVESHVIEAKIYGMSYDDQRSDGIVKSPAFPMPYSINGTVYTYYIANRDRKGAVQLVFTDLDLHPSSSIKIYDGWNTSAPSYVFTGPRMPVFQSKQSMLILVFKTGLTKNKAASEENTGFRAKYKFVLYEREDWLPSSVPSTGFCPEFNTSHGLVTVGARPGVHVYNYHCVWTLIQPFSTRMYYLKVYDVKLSKTGTELKIHDGRTSQSLLLYHKRVDISGGIQSLQFPGIAESVTAEFEKPNLYISLDGPMGEFDYITLVFTHWDTRQSSSYRVNIPVISKLPKYVSSGVCAFKRGLRYPNTCLFYWDTEKTDGSCDYYKLYKGCQKCQCLATQKCYGEDDLCDSFNDCGDLTTEKNCGGGKLWDGWKVIFLMVGAAAIVFILKDGNLRRQLWRGCRDCPCCSRSSWKDAWESCWKDSAVYRCLRQCPLSGRRTQRNTTEEQTSSRNSSGNTRASVETSTFVILPVRTRQPVCTSMSSLPPAYAECVGSLEDVAMGHIQPPSYEETVASGNRISVTPNEPPPAYQSTLKT